LLFFDPVQSLLVYLLFPIVPEFTIHKINPYTFLLLVIHNKHHQHSAIMTRGLYPPQSLSKEDIMTLAQVRKDIWLNAAKGFFLGGSVSYLGHRIVRFAHNRKLIDKSLGKNSAFAVVMIGSALGSFLMATTTGKNSVHALHPVFQRGAQPAAVPLDDTAKANYKDAKYRAQAAEDLRDVRNHSLSLVRERSLKREQLEAETNPEDLQRNRVSRRKSLASSFATGHGISDSHGGHWTDKEETKFRKE